MEKEVKKIMDIMNNIEYGFKDINNKNIMIDNPEKWDKDFYNFYYLLSPDELLDKKCGVCWDQVELERKLFEENKINYKTYFICTYDKNNLPSHTFLVYKDDNKYYWFEHSWYDNRGIHEYNSLEELLLDVKKIFISDNKNKGIKSNNDNTIIYEYKKPKYHITCQQFYNYMKTQKEIKIDL